MAKAENYTQEQTSKLVGAYVPGMTKEQVTEIAATIGKTARSAVAKLARLGVYVSPKNERAAKVASVKKNATAAAIGAVLGMGDSDAESLAKANKGALEMVWQALKNTVPAADAELHAAMAHAE